MNFCINERELLSALKDLRRARKNGFNFCLAVLEFDTVEDPHWLRLRYSDLWEKAHPTNGKYNWGRKQDVTRNCRFVEGKLIPLREESI